MAAFPTSTTVLDSILFRDAFGTPAMREVFSDLNLITLVVTRAYENAAMEPEYIQILRICRFPLSIAEISAKLGLPLSVIKILVADLIEEGLLIFSSPPGPMNTETPDMKTLQAVLDGIRRL